MGTTVFMASIINVGWSVALRLEMERCERDVSSGRPVMITYFTLLAQLFAFSDYYVPSSAAELTAGLCGLDDEALAVTITLWVLDLEGQLSLN